MGQKRKQRKPPQKPHFAYSVKKAALRLGVGKTSIYHLISTGALWTISIGNRQMVPRSALEGFVKSANVRA
jgi:excisionase family DNA binding protein